MLESGFYNMDCLEGMRGFPDKYFDLAIDTQTYDCYSVSEVIL